MRFRPIRWILNRSDQAGVFMAAAGAAATFQRTLMPRNNLDQAVESGLSMAINYQIASLIQDSVEAVASLAFGLARGGETRADDDEMRRATLAINATGIFAGLAVQKLLAQTEGESLVKAAGRTAGFYLAAGCLAGGAAGSLEHLAKAIDKRRGGGQQFGDLPLALAGGVAFAFVREFQRRQREAKYDSDFRERAFSRSISLPMGLGVGLTLAGLAALNRTAATRLGKTLEQVLPGDERVWRPVGHGLALALLAAGMTALVERVYGAIEAASDKIEPAYDNPPRHPLVSAGPGSLVPWNTLGFKGRRYVSTYVKRRWIEETMGEPAKEPIRAYVGLDSAANPEERVRLAIGELERTGAFERKLLVVASPTGTGQVNYVAVESAEYFSRGDCATIAVQYSKRPSPLSLNRIWIGRKQFRLLLSAIRRKLYAMAPNARPRLVVFGESLGAHTSQDPFLHTGTQGLVDGGIDGALWIGTPYLSQWKRQVQDGDRPDVDPTVVREFHGPEDLAQLSPEEQKSLRYVLLTNGNDPVAYFGPELLIQQPPWLDDPETRPPGVPGSQKWFSPLTFVQTLVDMKNALDITAGQFVANGHDYRANLARFVRLAYDLDATDEQLERVEQSLRRNEKERRARIESSSADEGGSDLQGPSTDATS